MKSVNSLLVLQDFTCQTCFEQRNIRKDHLDLRKATASFSNKTRTYAIKWQSDIGSVGSGAYQGKSLTVAQQYTSRRGQQNLV